MNLRRPRTTTAVAACPDCGDVRLQVADVTLVLLDGIMVFDCPGCGRRVNKPSPLHAEASLLCAGARLVLQ